MLSSRKWCVVESWLSRPDSGVRSVERPTAIKLKVILSRFALEQKSVRYIGT